MEKAQAEDYLNSLLNKTLRIHTTDQRMFLGQFKCTDSDRNVILSQAFEYRFPPAPNASELAAEQQGRIVKEMSSRYLGLVVVPGEYTVKIEVEEFVSQMKGK
ncbi:LSM domain-containing protein [Phlyctema vagabunda]|uniref:LSM domain-containing protein n=1 Tax=Phlyctema vagabunda TaxID=108571 RepID=A0ABR4P5J4_9HELO